MHSVVVSAMQRHVTGRADGGRAVTIITSHPKSHHQLIYISHYFWLFILFICISCCLEFLNISKAEAFIYLVNFPSDQPSGTVKIKHTVNAYSSVNWLVLLICV